MSRCVVVLKKILEQESKGWYIKYKDRLITELKGLHQSSRALLLLILDFHQSSFCG